MKKSTFPAFSVLLTMFISLSLSAQMRSSGNSAINTFINPIILSGDYPDPSINAGRKRLLHDPFCHIVTGFYSYDGMNWKQEPWSRDISGYHHNALYDFI